MRLVAALVYLLVPASPFQLNPSGQGKLTKPMTFNDGLRAAFRLGTPFAPWLSREAAVKPDVRQIQAFEELVNPRVEYPTYYDSPFHAYDEGNTCWESALDQEAAGIAVLRGAETVRDDFTNLALQYASSTRARYLRSTAPTKINVLDVGCGVGVSTVHAHRLLGMAGGSGGAVVGVDLSPHMLAVAAASTPEEAASGVGFVHAAAEALPFKDGSFDAVQICFVMHEVPAAVAAKILREGHRVLRRGGILGVLDFNGAPKASNLAMQYIFDRTEPFWDEYKVASEIMPELMSAAGFAYGEKHAFGQATKSRPIPKHAAWFGMRTQQVAHHANGAFTGTSAAATPKVFAKRR